MSLRSANDMLAEQQYVAQNAAMKTIIEVLLRGQLVSPEVLGGTLRKQAEAFDIGELAVAAEVLRTLAEFAEDPTRSAVRRLLMNRPTGPHNEPGIWT